MKLYQLTLPVLDNQGHSMVSAIDALDAYTLEVVGGCSRSGGISGLWRDQHNDKVYADQLVAWHIATAETVFRLVLAKAFELWPDQLAIFWAQIGTATIEHRQAKVAA